MPKREEEADGQRPLAVPDQLAGRVVDRGDVVGVERVPHPEGVGEHSGAHAKRLPRADLGVPADHGQCQQTTADDVQANHRDGHRAYPVPLGRRECGPDGGQASAPVCHGDTLGYLQITCKNAAEAGAN